jgi:hypothetical protein
MIFKELETKQVFDNSYGSSSYIDRYVYYNGTEQISIYIKTGYGASEKIINEVISEHDLEEWVAKFKSSVILPNSNLKPLLLDNKPSVILPKKQNMSSENVNEKSINNFDSMRDILFDTMREVKSGVLDIEKAKSISSVGQTIINSVKVEIDFLKLTGSSEKPKMIG